MPQSRADRGWVFQEDALVPDSPFDPARSDWPARGRWDSGPSHHFSFSVDPRSAKKSLYIKGLPQKGGSSGITESHKDPFLRVAHGVPQTAFQPQSILGNRGATQRPSDQGAVPRDKEYLLADCDGLYLRVRPTGKAWVYRYKRHGKEAKLSIGHYPE